MTLTVHTARVSYGGDDRLDVTRKSAGPEGIVFAPSWAILGPALDLLKCAEDVGSQSCTSCDRMNCDGQRIAHMTWALYSAAYAAEMRESYRTQRAAWRALLARESVTLVCYCTDPERCHRSLLASILEKLGAKNCGEVAHVK